MLKETLKMYGTDVHVLTYKGKEILEQQAQMEQENKLIVGDMEMETDGGLIMELAVDGGEMVEPSYRKKEMKYGEGFVFNKDRSVEKLIFVFADGVDEKQMSNIFLSLGVEKATVSKEGLVSVRQVEVKEEELEKAKMVDEGGTHPLEEEKAIEEKPKPKRRNRKKTTEAKEE